MEQGAPMGIWGADGHLGRRIIGPPIENVGGRGGVAVAGKYLLELALDFGLRGGVASRRCQCMRRCPGSQS